MSTEVGAPTLRGEGATEPRITELTMTGWLTYFEDDPQTFHMLSLDAVGYRAQPPTRLSEGMVAARVSIVVRLP